MNKKSPRNKHPWYERKRNLHFDFALKKKEAEDYVTKKDNVAKHSFSPLIYYSKDSRKYTYDKKTKKSIVINKSRNIFYASHVDGYIYSYYSFLLSDKYEKYLEVNGLSDVVSAYRSIKKNGKSFSNIDFANEAFEFVRASGGCKVLCIDISKFFDKLSMDVLKKNWAEVWSGGVSEKLDDDHYNIFRNFERFHYLREEDILKYFKVEPRRINIIDEQDKEAISRERNRSLHQRICSFQELKDKKLELGGNVLFKTKSTLKISGIPQGTAISGLLANIFMVYFDKIFMSKVEKMGGVYRRYSDDIFIAFPSEIDFLEIENYGATLLKSCSGDSIKINPDKTERHVFELDKAGVGRCYNDKGRLSCIQYLGFEFDGMRMHIRGSSISRNRAKIVRLIRKCKKGFSKKSQTFPINTREVYKAQSPRKITQADQVNSKGFPNYVKRAEKICEAPELKKQSRKTDKFIKKKIKEERSSKSSKVKKK